jgi:hypothetical protein
VPVIEGIADFLDEVHRRASVARVEARTATRPVLGATA